MKDKMPDAVYGLPYEDGNEYVRRDLYTALKERNARLVEALDHLLDSQQFDADSGYRLHGIKVAKQALAENKE